MYRRVNRFNTKRRVTSALPPYITFNMHTDKEKSPGPPVMVGESKTAQSVSVCAIDPGIRNCAIRIERRTFLRDASIPVTVLTTACPVIKVETVLQSKVDFVEATSVTKKPRGKKQTTLASEKAQPDIKETVVLDSCYYVNMQRYFDSILPLLSSCHYILIESQMPINTEMVRLSQGIITYLMINLRDSAPFFPNIIEIDAKIKSSAFDAPKMKKPELKKWAANKAVEILTENGDTETLKVMTTASKRDDHGDVICYTTAWFKILASGGFFSPARIPTHALVPDTTTSTHQSQTNENDAVVICFPSRSARLRKVYS